MIDPALLKPRFLAPPLLALFLMLGASPLMGQAAGGWQGEKPAPSATPKATPSATPTPAAAAAPASSLPPEEQIAAFFRQLAAAKVDDAYEALLKGSKIAEAATDVTMLRSKTREAIELIGSVTGAELIDTAAVGENLKRYTYLVLGKTYPLRWRFYYYRSENTWRLIDIRISDRLVEMFGEETPAPRPAGPQP